MTSTMTGFEFIQERSEATPGLWNRIFSTLSDNIGVAAFGPVDQFTIGDITSRVTTEILTVATSSATNDYIAFVDSSNAKSDYLIGSRVGGTADGLNLYDLSGDTMIVSFSKQSIRFFQNVTGPVFDTGGAYFNVKASGAIGNGIADDWAAIQSAFDAARLAGGGQVFFPAGSYSISTKIRYGSRTHVRGVGPSSILINATSRSLPGIMLEPFASGTTLFALSEMVLDQRGDVFGNDGSSNCVSIQQVQGANIYNNTFRNIMTMAVWTDAPSFNTTRDVVIQNNTIENSLGGGISVFGCMFNWVIANNVIADCRDDAIAIQGNSTTKTGRDITIANNVIRDCRSRGTSGAGDATPRGILVQAAENVSVIGNAIHRLVAGGIVIDDAPQHYKRPINVTVIGNVITDTGSIVTNGPTSGSTAGVPMNGIYVANSDVVNVVGNSIASCAQIGIFLQHCSRTVVEGNTCNDNNMDGLNVSYSSHIQVIGNHFINNAFNGSTDEPYGIVLISNSSVSRCENIWIVGNTVTDTRTAGKTQTHGIFVSGSSTSDIHVYQNMLYGNATGAIGGINPIRSRYAFNHDGDQADKITNWASGTSLIVGGPILMPDGTALLPSSAFSSEQSLGWYRSGVSGMSLSYGTLVLNSLIRQTASSSILPQSRFLGGSGNHGQFSFGRAADEISILIPNSNGAFWNNTRAGDSGIQSHSGGTLHLGMSGVMPQLSMRSVNGRGLVQANFATDFWASGISIGNTTAAGSLIQGISSMSSLIGAFVVQPSASSFTIVTWTGVQPGDQILTTVQQSGAVSSLSSGLVLHSHCTQANQIEFRLSNVSTLAQNQSSRTYFFTRIQPF